MLGHFKVFFINFKKLVIIETLEERHPGIFGPTGGFSRAYALGSMSWTLGMLLGPLLSGCTSPFISLFLIAAN